jgi:prepilin-type N-terminal cleavage/methylation domain-containing protein
MKKAYSLIEILIVVALMSVVLILGYRVSRAILGESVQLSQAGASQAKNQYDEFVAVVNDRLSQAWSYNIGIGTNGSTLYLLDANGLQFAELTVASPDNQQFVYQFVDTGTNYTANPLTLTYNFTDAPTYTNADFLLQEVPGSPTTVNWKIPPPLYYTADYPAFRGIFLANTTSNFLSQVDEQRTNYGGLLQHDIQTFTWSPLKHAFR